MLLWSLHELGLVSFVDYVQVGIKLGLLLVVLVLFPIQFRQHERRLAQLENLCGKSKSVQASVPPANASAEASAETSAGR